MKRKAPTCVYCGEAAAATGDHIPPKCLVAPPRPADLITVPACERCNKSFEKDDTYFRDCVVLEQRCGDHPEAKKVIAASLRGLARPESVGYRKYFLSRLGKVELRTSSGLYAGRKGGYNVDLGRLSRVLSRIVRGVYYHETGAPLPLSCTADGFFFEDFDHLPTWELQRIRDTVVAPTLRTEPRTVARGVMRYWFGKASDREHASAWVFELYGGLVCYGITIPAQ